MAARDRITLAQWAEAYDYNPQTGEFRWKWRPETHYQSASMCRGCNLRFAGTVAATTWTKGHIYLRMRICGVQSVVGAHTLAWALMTGEWPADGMEVDHRDRDSGNNRWSNLRLADQPENAQNRGRVRDQTTSRFKGVFGHKDGRWSAHITCNKKGEYLGVFQTEEAAAVAYNDGARRLHGEFAVLNDVDDSHRAVRSNGAGKTGIKGVTAHPQQPGVWMARGAGRYLGVFRNPIEAGLAVIAVEKRL